MDNFKAVNDTLGHAVGDELLVFLAGLIRDSKRREDYGVRLGGDEFVVLMAGCGLERAEAFGQRLITLFRQHTRIVVPKHLPVDLSIGVAQGHPSHRLGPTAARGSRSQPLHRQARRARDKSLQRKKPCWIPP